MTGSDDRATRAQERPERTSEGPGVAITRVDGADLLYVSDTSVLLIGDCEAASERAAGAARAAGVRIAASVGLEDAIPRLDRQARTGAVFLELAAPPSTPAESTALDALLARLESEAGAGRFGSVVSTPSGMIDLVAALAPHGRIQQLADANDVDRAAALVIAAGSAALSFHDNGRTSDAARIRQLSDDVARIAGALARLSAGTVATGRKLGPPPGAPGEALGDESPASPLASEAVRAIIRARRMRAHYFEADLFADPAWDMLLDLMAARLDQQRVAVSSLCIASAVPATTALRWIKTLTDSGLFVRRADPTDGRRVFIELGDDAAAAMAAYLTAAARTTPPGAAI